MEKRHISGANESELHLLCTCPLKRYGCSLLFYVSNDYGYCDYVIWKKSCTIIFTRGQFWPSGIVVACVCVCVSVCLSVCLCVNHEFVRAITLQARITKFGAQMQNTLVKVAIVLWGDRPWPWRSNLTWKSNFTSFWAFPDDNLSSVQARVTKFGPKMHLSMVKIPIDLRVYQPWSSGSILT